MITIKEIAPYLPYNVKYMGEYGGISILRKVEFCRPYNEEKKCFTDEIGIDGYLIQYVKLILHPLSDLTKEIEVNGEKFVPLDYIETNMPNNDYKSSAIMTDATIEIGFYKEFQKLFEWHFDVFGLIKRGGAIDINTL